jgi:hypothetical protein
MRRGVCCFHFLILKTVSGFSGGDLAEFAAVNGFYAGSGNTAVVEAFLAQCIVKNRRFVFPFWTFRRLFRSIAAQNVHVGIPAEDARLIAKIIEELLFRFS